MDLPIEFNVLVIDDGSPDGTAAIVKRLMAGKYKDRVFLVERSGKLGLGTAYICGFQWAIEHKADYIFEMDADFSRRTCLSCTTPVRTKVQTWRSEVGM